MRAHWPYKRRVFRWDLAWRGSYNPWHQLERKLLVSCKLQIILHVEWQILGKIDINSCIKINSKSKLLSDILKGNEFVSDFSHFHGPIIMWCTNPHMNIGAFAWGLSWQETYISNFPLAYLAISCKCVGKPDKVCPYLGMHEKSWSKNSNPSHLSCAANEQSSADSCVSQPVMAKRKQRNFWGLVTDQMWDTDLWDKYAICLVFSDIYC